MPVSFALTELFTDVLCGRTTGASEPDRWIHTALWSCAPCSRIEAADRALALWVRVAVPERSAPAWTSTPI